MRARFPARQRPADPAVNDISAARAWDFDCIDGAGRVLMRGKDLVNLFFRVTPSYHSARTHPLGGWLGGLASPTPAAGVTLWQVPMLPEDLCTQSGGICLRIIAHVILAQEERDEWRALQGPLRRRREWLFGRAALKEAVRHWVHEQTGEMLYDTEIIVRHDEHGAPWVDGEWCQGLIAAPQVSLSHQGETCLAAVAAPGQPVGVDLEDAARLRQPELVVDSFAPAERVWVEGLVGAARAERVLRLWCAKEAAAKCLGTGLQGQPEAFRVIAADDKCEKLLVESDWGTVGTWVQEHQGTIIAVATQEPGDIEVHG